MFYGPFIFQQTIVPSTTKTELVVSGCVCVCVCFSKV